MNNMRITDSDQINWLKKYYVVEGKSFYQGDTFTAQSAWTTKEEAIAEKNHTMNLDDLRLGLRTRYRHRTLSGIDVQRLLYGI